MNLYKQHCQNCHKADGMGFRQLFPPLRGSEYLNDKKRIPCIILHGMKGEISVKGQTFNQEMPSNPKLTPLEIAEIMTFIYSEWAGEEVITEIGFVRNALDSCRNQ